MKQLLKSKNLPLVVLGLGGIGFALRKALYAVAVDRKALLLSGHPLEILLWLVTAAVLALVIVGVRKRKGSPMYQDNFGSSRLASVGTVVAMAGIAQTLLLPGRDVAGTLGLVWKATGFASILALGAIAGFQIKGRKPFFLLYGIVCIFFAIHMVSCYQGWSSNPQIQDYVFTLFASVGLMLFSYQQTAFAADAGNAQLQTGIGLLTVFSCIVALSGTDNLLLYLAGAVWVLTNLCHEA